jgi:hypothetical protein
MYVKSKYPKIEIINEIPIIGSFALIIFSALPGAFLTLYSIYINEIQDNLFEVIALSSFVFWNLFLAKIGIKIYLFLIPAWIFWIIAAILILVFDF